MSEVQRPWWSSSADPAGHAVMFVLGAIADCWFMVGARPTRQILFASLAVIAAVVAVGVRRGWPGARAAGGAWLVGTVGALALEHWLRGAGLSWGLAVMVVAAIALTRTLWNYASPEDGERTKALVVLGWLQFAGLEEESKSAHAAAQHSGKWEDCQVLECAAMRGTIATGRDSLITLLPPAGPTSGPQFLFPVEGEAGGSPPPPAPSDRER